MSDTARALKPWEPNELNARHKQIAVLSASGLKNYEVAEVVDMSQSRVSVILNDPRVKKLKRVLAERIVDGYVEDAKAVLAKNQREAAETMVFLMNNADSENVRRLSAADILDRTGHKPREVVTHQEVSIDGETGKMLIEVIRESERDKEELEFVEDSSGVFKQDNEEDPFLD